MHAQSLAYLTQVDLNRSKAQVLSWGIGWVWSRKRWGCANTKAAKSKIAQEAERCSTMPLTVDKRQSQNRLVTSQACCSVHGAVKLTSSGLLACRIFGRSGSAEIADTVEPSLSEMVRLQRKSERTMRRYENNEAYSCLSSMFRVFVLLLHVCASGLLGFV